MSAEVAVYVGASSPLLNYSPSRNGQAGSSWIQIPGGASECSGPASYSVELNALHFTEIRWLWEPSSTYSVQIGLDGTLQSGSASSGGATLSSTFANHTARLETTCPSSSTSDSFRLIGAEVQTQLTSSGPGTNATLDDASSQITYSGFTSCQQSASTIPAIQSGTFYQSTVSYTSSAGATASFRFDGSALFIFGPTGPSFGVYQVEIDKSLCGIYNASTSIDTYDTLLFFATHLDAGMQHDVVVTNQVDGMMFALDYVVAVQAGQSTGSEAPPPMAPTAILTSTVPSTVVLPSSPATVAAIFPSDSSIATATSAAAHPSSSNSNGSAGNVIGGILGALAALVSTLLLIFENRAQLIDQALLWFLWRYYLWKRAGGEGDFCAAVCGPCCRIREKEKVVKFKAWPMMKFKPKYDTYT